MSIEHTPGGEDKRTYATACCPCACSSCHTAAAAGRCPGGRTGAWQLRYRGWYGHGAGHVPGRCQGTGRTRASSTSHLPGSYEVGALRRQHQPPVDPVRPHSNPKVSQHADSLAPTVARTAEERTDTAQNVGGRSSSRPPASMTTSSSAIVFHTPQDAANFGARAVCDSPCHYRQVSRQIGLVMIRCHPCQTMLPGETSSDHHKIT